MELQLTNLSFKESGSCHGHVLLLYKTTLIRFSVHYVKKTVSCAHMGEREVKRHIESLQHQKNSKSMKHIKPLSFPTLSLDKVCT